MADYLKLFGDTIAKEMPGFISISIIEVKSGITFFSKNSNKNFDLEHASRFALEIIRAQLNANYTLGKNQTIEDIVVMLSDQLQILKMSENNDYFIYLVVNASKANLAFTRALLNKSIKEISKNLKS
ncbi:hypothetical protein [Flavobacterium luminosum]|uniref:Roadblock/LC7 domain-containing protein n=1 Tax=Flavobacterium luminosum TaxID=2949086 RepID=A0ABT0TP60_9FLAO|nr:hypothetical protein [Flavobacterium sp. HXWNR70]MCL9809284.1 hypothetical protein [Flavobacterium sp. HXWNR70]